jgi:hypothetical protein
MAEPFPELLPAAAPAASMDAMTSIEGTEAMEAPAEAPADSPPPMFATTFGAAAARPPRSRLPWILLAAALLLAAGLFLLRDQLMGWMGLGGGEEVAQTAAPRPRKTPRVRPGAASPVTSMATTSDTVPATSASPVTAAPSTAPPEPAPSEAPPPPAAASVPPAPAPAPPVVAPTVERAAPLTALDRITFEAAGGGTDLILWGNGAIPAAVYTRTRIDGNPPRELFRLSGIRQPFGKTRVVVGTPELLQVRVGYHGGNELHVVLDLAHPNVTVTQVEPGPGRLKIHLQRH